MVRSIFRHPIWLRKCFVTSPSRLISFRFGSPGCVSCWFIGHKIPTVLAVSENETPMSLPPYLGEKVDAEHAANVHDLLDVAAGDVRIASVLEFRQILQIDKAD